MSRFFLIITIDPELSSQGGESKYVKKGSALELASSRLDRKSWPLYRRTTHRKHVDSDSKLAFYIGGTKRSSKQIIASASVKSINDWSWKSDSYDGDKYCTDLPSKIIHLKHIKYLQVPVSLREIMPTLSICPKNMKYWGVAVQGGVTEITASDWEIIFG